MVTLLSQRELQPVGVVGFEPDEKHWHGASPSAALTHIAIHETQTVR
jgi:quercetin dioxygenase-like cupin family protein